MRRTPTSRVAAVTMRWAWCVLTGVLGASGSARAEASPGLALEVAWRWGVSPAAASGPRVLDQVDLALRVPVGERFALVPHFGIGVSYGATWVMLGSFGLEAMYVRVRPRYLTYGGGGVLAFGETRGAGRLRDSLADDVGLVVRGGFLRTRGRFEVGAEGRVAVGLAGRVEVAGPLDLGLAARFGVRLGAL